MNQKIAFMRSLHKLIWQKDYFLDLAIVDLNYRFINTRTNKNYVISYASYLFETQ